MVYETKNHLTELTKSSVQNCETVKSAELEKSYERKLRNDLRSTELKIVQCKDAELLKFGKKPNFFRVYISNESVLSVLRNENYRCLTQ